jgi:glycosyltransferase involved in cell wall biosynthesis
VPVATSLPKRELRVYVLTPSFPPTLGGQENHLLELSASLIEAGARVLVITRRVSPDVPACESLGTVPVRRLTPFGAVKGVGFRAIPRLGLLLFKMAWRLIRDRRRYDIVLVSGFNFMPLAPVVAGILTGRPCVVRPESPLEVGEPVGPDSRAKMSLSATSPAIRAATALRRWAAARVARYIAISSEIRAGLERFGIEAGRIASIPNGISLERFAPVTAVRKTQLRELLRLPVNGLLLIYTGRLALSKGVMMLIDIWRELAPRHPEAHLLIVGTGQGCFDDCEPELRNFIAAHALVSRVTLTGAVSNVHEYLQASDLFVFPSDYEGFSLSILEAMTAALPMVCTRVGVAAELERTVSGRFALLVPPQDRAGFHDALQQLLAQPELRSEMGANAHAAVRSEYSLTGEARRYVAVFGELIERRP